MSHGRARLAGLAVVASVLLGSGSASAQISFRQAPTFAADSCATSVRVADFNGDTKQDLALGSGCSGADGDSTWITVLVGSGDGTFGPATRFEVGPLPGVAGVADFNRDGRADLAVNTDGGVSILLGDGAGAFGTPLSDGIQSGPLGIADLDGDGNVDLVLGRFDTIAIFLGDGSGHFSAQGTYAADLGPRQVTVADLNGDTSPDLVVASQNSVSRFLGDGAGGFGPRQDYAVGDEHHAVAVADFNGDSNADLVAANYYSGSLSVLLGDGSGGFGTPLDISIPTRPIGLAVADFNRDGALDLAVQGDGAGIIVLAGDGAGAFALPEVSFPFPSYAGGPQVGDFDDNDIPDLAVISDLGVSMLLGDGAGGFPDAVIALLAGSGASAVADFNGDANADLAVLAPSMRCAVLSGNGAGRFGSPTFLDPAVFSVAADDFDSDGVPDLAVVTGGCGDGDPAVAVHFGDGAGGFASVLNVVLECAESLAVGDFNGDGKADLAVATTGASVSILLGDGLGGLGTPLPFAAQGITLAVGDFNRDGRTDIAVAESSSVSILLGNDTSGVVAGGTFPVPPNPRSLASGDFDGDGNVDLAVAGEDNACADNCASLSLLLGDGTGGFGSPLAVASRDGSPGGLVVADFDGDGTPDIAVNGLGGEVSGLLGTTILAGKGDGSFRSAVSFGSCGGSLTVGDFNRDGRPDLVAGGCILINLTPPPPAPSIRVADATAAELSGTIALAVSLGRSWPEPVRVNYGTADGSAKAVEDYVATSGTVTFAPGSTTLSVAVPLMDDTVGEPAETFSLFLSNAIGATIADSRGVATITDDDTAPTISIADVSVTEGDSGTTDAVFTVSLSDSPAGTLTVNYATSPDTTSPGTANAGSDYLDTAGTLTFAPGTTALSATVQVIGDSFVEPAETFYVGLDGAVGGVIARGRAKGTIVDDDRAAGGFEVVDPACSGPTACSGPVLRTRDTCEGTRVFVTDEVQSLATAPLAVRAGAVIDGTTLLLIRAQSVGPVTFALKRGDGQPADATWGQLMDRNGCSKGSSLQVASEGGYVFAVYRVPNIWPGGTGEPGSGGLLRVEAAELGASKNLQLKEPPVVLVHGLWSRPSAWNTFARWLRSYSYDVSTADYEAWNNWSFDPTLPDSGPPRGRLASAVFEAKDALRAKGIAVTQVDVVGHSMGGLVARSWVASRRDRLYRQDTNYQQGEFRKLITIGTPHYGSPFATWLAEHQCSGRLQVEMKLSKKPFGDAIFDLEPASGALQVLGQTRVPGHAVYSQAPPFSYVEASLNLVLFPWTYVDTLLDPPPGDGSQHDTIVPIPSQKGGLVGNATSSVSGAVHAGLASDVDETTSYPVFASVVDALTQPVNDVFKWFPQPEASGVFVPPATCRSAEDTLAPEGTATITPTAGEVFRPGDVALVTFSVEGGQTGEGAIVRLGNQVQSATGPGPFSFSFTLPDVAGRIDLDGSTAGGVETYTASSYVMSAPASLPVEIETTPAVLEFSGLGEQAQLRVFGIYPDGARVDITSGTAGTSYGAISGDASTVSVTPDGFVTAEGSGQDAIVVASGGLMLQVPVVVSITNHAPALRSLQDVVMGVGQRLDLTLAATDPDGDSVRYAAVNAPSFVRVVGQGATASLRLTPAAADVGTHGIVVSATDDGVPSLGDVKKLTVTVADRVVSVFGTRIREGNNGTHDAVFRVILSSRSAQPVAVTWGTADGSATAGSDYIGASGTVTIPAGRRVGIIRVTIIGDRTPEPTESFFVLLTGATNATIRREQARGIIADDDAPSPRAR